MASSIPRRERLLYRYSSLPRRLPHRIGKLTKAEHKHTWGLTIREDRTIIATAVPRITDDFNSLGDVGWYASTYMITSCAFQLFFGRIYTFCSPRWVFLVATAIFEVGSALCGAAPNSTAFIVGRAIAGLSSAGMISGARIVIVYTVPLHK